MSFLLLESADMYILDEESGQGLVEYALLLVLVSIVVVIGLTIFGTAVTSFLRQILDVF